MSSLGSELIENAANGNHERVRDLLPSGANANIMKDDMITALMMASRQGHAEVVDTLLTHGALKVNESN